MATKFETVNSGTPGTWSTFAFSVSYFRKRFPPDNNIKKACPHPILQYTMPVDNIWDAAIELQRAAEKNGTSTLSESTLLFAGNRHSGKTSLMYRFVEKAEAVKPSLALDYIFARKSRGASTLKEICHIWELAGGSLSTHLLEVPINKRSLPALSVVLVMDLSTPEVLCVTLEALLKEVRRQIELVISSATKRNKDYEALLPGSSRVSNDHPVWSHSVSRSDAACG